MLYIGSFTITVPSPTSVGVPVSGSISVTSPPPTGVTLTAVVPPGVTLTPSTFTFTPTTVRVPLTVSSTTTSSSAIAWSVSGTDAAWYSTPALTTLTSASLSMSSFSPLPFSNHANPLRRNYPNRCCDRNFEP